MGAVVLIVEDEERLGRNMRTFLERSGHAVVHALDVAGGRRHYSRDRPDIVLVDHNLPDGTGLGLIEEIRREDRLTKLVMITAHGGVDLAVSAMKAGADDYLTKPVSLDELSLLVGKLARQMHIEGTLAVLRAKDEERSGIDLILGESPAIRGLKRKIGAIAAADAALAASRQPGPPVLILGETGTGKELIARALHFAGPRRDGAFVPVNCAALPEHLIEAELFGHEKGAFTGAAERSLGLVRAAEGGTLFLDELAELPLTQQAKLLRTLEERVVRAVGGVHERPVDVRFVAATAAGIEDRVRDGAFRSDLYYRLNTITIEAPPLRDRGEDLLLMADGFVTAAARRYGRPAMALGRSAREILLRHDWPGNVRELRNVIEQAVLMSQGARIESADIVLRGKAGQTRDQGAAPALADRSRDTAECEAIIAALRANSGNVSLAARALGISRDTLRYRMEKHGLRRDYYFRT